MYKKYYSKFLSANPNVQHYASHSHHYWPDVTLDATIEYWNDSAKYVDAKWGFFFENKIPQTQSLIAEILNLSHPDQIVFAPNTQELAYRLISSLPLPEELNPESLSCESQVFNLSASSTEINLSGSKISNSDPLVTDQKNTNTSEEERSANRKIRILTTDSEFYSFDRLANRLNETSRYEFVKVPVEPFSTFEDRFIKAIKNYSWDMIFFSQVFFNSGYEIKNFENIVHSTSGQTIVVMDGYHGFMAIPTDLKSVENKLYYLAGSYKYAQGGEGGCFLVAPKGSKLRPRQTGWFATLSQLDNMTEDASDHHNENDTRLNQHTDDDFPTASSNNYLNTNPGSKNIKESITQASVPYSKNANRFAGSTMDFTALYRLNSVLTLFKNENLTVNIIHKHVKKLQSTFIKDIQNIPDDFLKQQLNPKNLIIQDLNYCGHFLTYNLADIETVEKTKHLLKEKFNILVDSRGTRLRFGFGLYQNETLNFKALLTN